MFVYTKNKVNRKRSVRGGGLINSIINSLPFELHLPGYQYCGPGTKLEKRLQRGDRGINPLDAACKLHDIAYSQSENISKRHQADRELAEKAWMIVKDKNNSLREKVESYFVTNAMKAKVKFGMGIQKKNSKKICGRKIFNNAVKNATAILKNEKPQDINSAIKMARKAIKDSFRGKKTHIIIPRVLRVPKVGGFLPLIPILTALGALGGLSSGGAAIARAVNSAKNAKKELEENRRHNTTMESIAIGKGLYLKPYKRGYGICFNGISKN